MKTMDQLMVKWWEQSVLPYQTKLSMMVWGKIIALLKLKYSFEMDDLHDDVAQLLLFP